MKIQDTEKKGRRHDSPMFLAKELISMCQFCDKKIFLTERGAQIVAVQTGGKEGGVIEYRCPRGKGWHVGHKHKNRF